MSYDDGYSLARSLLLVKVFTDEMNRRRKGHLAAEAERVMPAGTRLPVLIDGQHVGWVSMPKPSTRVTVTDERKLLAFVKEKFATEVETVERIRPAFLTVLKEAAKAGGWVDEQSGEITEIPGMAIETGDLTPRAEPAADAFAVVAAALRDGLLEEARGLLAIEGGE